MAPASSKEFLDIQATVECGFTLKLVRDMIKSYNQDYSELHYRFQILENRNRNTVKDNKIENNVTVVVDRWF